MKNRLKCYRWPLVSISWQPTTQSLGRKGSRRRGVKFHEKKANVKDPNQTSSQTYPESPARLEMSVLNTRSPRSPQIPASRPIIVRPLQMTRGSQCYRKGLILRAPPLMTTERRKRPRATRGTGEAHPMGLLMGQTAHLRNGRIALLLRQIRLKSNGGGDPDFKRRKTLRQLLKQPGNDQASPNSGQGRHSLRSPSICHNSKSSKSILASIVRFTAPGRIRGRKTSPMGHPPHRRSHDSDRVLRGSTGATCLHRT